MFFCVECGKSYFHQFQLIDVFSLLHQFILKIVVIDVILSKRIIVVLPETSPCGCSEIVNFFGLASKGTFVFKSNIFLFDHSVAVSHVLSWSGLQILHYFKFTCFLRFVLNLSSLYMTPRGLFLVTASDFDIESN